MMTIRKFLSIFALILCVCARAQSVNYGLPVEIQDGNILHCFNWTLADIQSELPRIAAAGFGAVQVSPLQGNTVAADSPWSDAYAPADIAFCPNATGTFDELSALCSEAARYGIKIVVDVVANQVNGSDAISDKFWHDSERVRNDGAVNDNDRSSITCGNIDECPDVVSENADVQARARAYVDKLIGAGVKGIRWDAAKHIALPSEDCNFWPAVIEGTGIWHYGEIVGNPAGNNSDKLPMLAEYMKYMSVTDDKYASDALVRMADGMVPLKNENYSSRIELDARRVVLWGESHKTYSADGGTTKNVEQDIIDRIWALGACKNAETALYLSRPAATSSTAIKAGVKGSTHALESPVIAAVNHFRNAMVGQADAYSCNSSRKSGWACVVREQGAVIVLPKAGTREVTVTNSINLCTPGKYRDVLSGNEFTVTDGGLDDGTVSGVVGSTGVAVLMAADAGAGDIVADVAAACGTPVYYDMFGRQVANPQSGIYIRVTGATVERVVLSK